MRRAGKWREAGKVRRLLQMPPALLTGRSGRLTWRSEGVLDRMNAEVKARV